MDETITAAHCVACDRTGCLSTDGGRYWCSWCGGRREIVLRQLDVMTRHTADRFTVDGQLIDPQNVPLQPLRITEGWCVSYNGGFYEVDPTPATIPWWWIFKSSMLMLVHERRKRLLDLSWTDEMNVEHGQYRLVVHEGDHRGRELMRLESRDRAEIVTTIERTLERVTNGAL